MIKKNVSSTKYKLYDRDLSWLSFNGRILREAGSAEVPLLEKINFLAIFSSNLDEFYRVRMPVISAIKKINKKEISVVKVDKKENVQKTVKRKIDKQMVLFGHTLEKVIMPELKKKNIYLSYNRSIPHILKDQAKAYFYETLASFLEVYDLDGKTYFPTNNSLYFVFTREAYGNEQIGIINIPSDKVSRFYTSIINDKTYVVFIDDIIRQHLADIFPGQKITGIYTFKITRDADLNLEDEFEGSLATKIEKKIKKRDFGLATRFLYQPDIPQELLAKLNSYFNLTKVNAVKGGYYHNLKDFFSFPIKNKDWQYIAQPPIKRTFTDTNLSLFDQIRKRDILINTPYESYNNVLRFFNEAALNQKVKEIYTSMYRVASDSRILNALISAVKNGKKVTVFVELKARFDEENNIYWAKKLKQAGVNVLYSIPNLKVHAKIALIVTSCEKDSKYLGLLSTGNLNEKTAKIYADHILLTANQDILKELKNVFNVLRRRRKKGNDYTPQFNHLLVAQFNLVDKFSQLIDFEIAQAKEGKPAAITIKINNLEEKQMIHKLYEASQAGVTVNLIVRSICRLIPGVKGVSDNITVKRIVDRYLEHSRVFIFHHKGEDIMYLGSADWINRNLFKRIEVCFPIVSDPIKKEIQDIIEIQLSDNTSADLLGKHIGTTKPSNAQPIRAQQEIYTYCKTKKVRYEK